MIAEFESVCAECGHAIHAGDEIIAHTDGWQHAFCSQPKRDMPVCTVCWLTHAPGHCDRD